MKSALTLIFVVAVTLFAPVSNAATSSYAATETYQRGTRTGSSSFTYSCGAGSYYAIPSGADTNVGSTMSSSWPSACDGQPMHAIYTHSSTVRYYYWGESQKACPANSTLSGTSCNANTGFHFDDEGNVVENAACSGDQFYQQELNSCTYFPCDGSTPYMQPNGTGGYTCEPPPASAGCYPDDVQWLATGGEAGSALPGEVMANGCKYRPMTCAEAAALEGLSSSECPGGSDPFSQAACVDGSCGGWYVGTGEGSFVDEDTTPPMTGTPSGGGGDPGGGDGGDGGDGDNTPGTGDGSGADGDDGNPSACQSDPGGVGCPDEEEGDEESWTRPGYGKGNFPDINEQVNESRNKLYDEFDKIKGQLANKFSISESGSGSLPCETVNIGAMGEFSLCLSDYSDQLSQIGNILVAAFTLLALFIVLS